VEAAAYRRLLPETGEIDAIALVETLELPGAGADAQRPYTVGNFVVSLDGHTTLDGQSRKLSDAGDRELFRALREHADAVLVGPGTLAAERYTRMLKEPERRARRLAAALSAEPLLATVTRSCRLPLDIPVFGEPEAQIVVFSPTPPDTDKLAATVIHNPHVELSSVLQILHHDHGIRTLVCEGGPQLFGALIRAHLIDELFVTIAPLIVGGQPDHGVVSGIADSASDPANSQREGLIELELVGALERSGTLFLRYRLRHG
jgi:riboflavin-specific deaminase-like protein